MLMLCFEASVPLRKSLSVALTGFHPHTRDPQAILWLALAGPVSGLSLLWPQPGIWVFHLSLDWSVLFAGATATALLLRFSDAMRELGSHPGIQVHRSHWVADCAVLRLDRRDGRRVVVLKSGREVPVSRSYAAAAQDRWGPD